MYTPQPMDTTGIVLAEELEMLVEQISKYVHEVWAKNRLSQGRTYGELRNGEIKTHPCLIPYEELPKEEKEYDRNTAQLVHSRHKSINNFTMNMIAALAGYSFFDNKPQVL